MPSSSSPAGPSRPRRVPKQRRSREIVRAILGATRDLLAREEPGAVTTNRIAERAGVSIGSLYRYFPDKAAVLAAVYETELDQEASRLETHQRDLESRSLEESLAKLVDFQLERHLRLLDLGGEFYRHRHRGFSLTRCVDGRAVQESIGRLLRLHADDLAVRNVDEAAYLLARGVSGILRLTVDEAPEKLSDPAFRSELVDLLTRYVCGGRR